MSGKTLRLILGDQLNPRHSWFKKPDDDVIYLIAELLQETGYVKHHVQKVCAFFAAMAHFSTALAKAGHQVTYLTLDDTCSYDDLGDLLNTICKQENISRFEYQLPDERRLREQLANIDLNDIVIEAASTEHFLLTDDELHQYINPQKHNRLDAFYRKLRKRFDVLMEGDKPAGGQWNYDADNRESLSADDLEDIPEPLCFSNDVSEILKRLDRHKVNYFGKAETNLLWPVTRQQSVELLDFFCQHCLTRFGQFQDAMTANSDFAWSLYHSRLSFAINSKMLHPWQVIRTALEAYEKSKEVDNNPINLAQIEGFVRQILGWREYVRAVYWVNSDHYPQQNLLKAERPLPRWFWDGDTDMACLRHAITQSLDYAYAHHIQRLMIVGNFALLAGLDPDEVEAWYLGIYIDAIEWVEQPNTRSMALFADGGWVATKPYAASGNYVHKMSDYCKGCRYQVKEKTGDEACPLNSMYWHFLYRHRSTFSENPRMAFPYKTWNRMNDDNQQLILQKGDDLLADLNSL